MKVGTLTRENVASHLQKYRLSLKRQANISESAMIDDDTWPLLEAAHAQHIASLDPPLRVDAQEGTSKKAASLTEMHTHAPWLASMDPPPQHVAEVAKPPSLPPMLPQGAVLTRSPSSHVAAPNMGLPSGFSVPPANEAGEAAGIPVPAHMFQPSSRFCLPSVRASHLTGSAAASAEPDSRAATPVLCPLALPERPASLMPEGFSAERLHQRVADEGHILSDGATCPTLTAWQPFMSASCNDPQMCTVYMLEPSAMMQRQQVAGTPTRLPALAVSPPGARLNVNAARVPKVMLAVSVAAYNSLGGDGTHGNHRTGHGNPAQAMSSGSACRRRSSGGVADEGTSAARLRRPVLGRLSSSARRSSRVSAQIRSCGSPMYGSTDALDVLAEVAGRLAEEGHP
jgi:hypothetical protein